MSCENVDFAAAIRWQRHCKNKMCAVCGKEKYSQFTFSVTVVSRRWPSGMARFHTTQRYFAPSSSRFGVTDRVLVVWRSFEPPLLIGACNGTELPSRYQLKYSKEILIIILFGRNIYPMPFSGIWKVSRDWIERVNRWQLILTWRMDQVNRQCCCMSNRVSFLRWPLQCCRAQPLAAVAVSIWWYCNTPDGHRRPCRPLWRDTRNGHCPDYTMYFECVNRKCHDPVGSPLWKFDSEKKGRLIKMASILLCQRGAALTLSSSI